MQEKSIPLVSFEKLVINGNFKVVLIENGQPVMQIQGESEILNFIKVFQNQKELRISGNIPNPGQHQILVTIQVRHLKSLLVNSNAEVLSSGRLQSGHLNIMLDASCLVKIKNIGEITVSHNEDYDLTRIQ